MAKRIMSWKTGCVYPIPNGYVDDSGQLVLNRQSIRELSPELMILMSDDVVATALPECPAAVIYGHARWDKVRKQLEALPNMEPEGRWIQRVMLGNLDPVETSDELKLSQPVTAHLLPRGNRPDLCMVVFDSASAEIWSYDQIVGIVGKPEPEESALIKFFRGDGTDHAGRTLEDILALDDFWLEHTHDYLQWLFPIPEPSQYNARVPVLTREDIAWFRTDRHLRAQQIRGLDRMLAFYGLERRDEGIVALPVLNMKTHIWLKPAGHNHLRITRIIRSLQHCSQPALALNLQSVVIELGKGVGQVSDKSIEFWRSARS